MYLVDRYEREKDEIIQKFIYDITGIFITSLFIILFIIIYNAVI